MPTDQPARLITYADLSDAAGVPINTVRQWVRRGKLPAPDYRVGQSPAWLPATIQPWLDKLAAARKDPK